MSSVVNKVDHVCIAVRSIEHACRMFVDVLGAEFIGGGDNPRLGVRAVQLRLPPGVKFELLQPLDPEGWMARFIERNGEGFHHMTAYTSDVLTAVDELGRHGFETVDTNLDHPSWHETFTRPSSTFGALIQLANPADAWEAPLPGITLTDVLEGKLQILDNVVTWKESGKPVWPQE